MAAKIITIAIEKGGTGKTVTASNLAYLMGEDGKRVLCIDTDPQGNLTSALSDGQGEIAGGMYDGKALYDMFTGFRYTNTKDYITETEYGDNVQMIPASSQTPRINQRMPELFEDATIIAKKDSSKQIASIADFLYYFLSQVRDEYDYILIDTQPTRDSLLLTNAINAADYVLIPYLCALQRAVQYAGKPSEGGRGAAYFCHEEGCCDSSDSSTVPGGFGFLSV